MHTSDIQLCLQHTNDEPTYDCWDISQGIDSFVKTEFTCGGCFALAVAINDVTGWPIHGIENSHYYVINNDGKAVDIYGIRPTDKAPTKYDMNRTPEFETIICVKTFDRKEIDIDYYEWASLLVKSFPNHFGIYTK